MRGFEYKVAHIVEGHVLAKRYLTGTDKSYNDKLSSVRLRPAVLDLRASVFPGTALTRTVSALQGSQRTLAFQGGPMTEEEARIFETDSLFEENVQMRRWDEGAKVEGLAVPPFEHYKEAVMASVKYASCDVETFGKVGGLAYERDGNKILAPAFQASL